MQLSCITSLLLLSERLRRALIPGVRGTMHHFPKTYKYGASNGESLGGGKSLVYTYIFMPTSNAAQHLPPFTFFMRDFTCAQENGVCHVWRYLATQGVTLHQTRSWRATVYARVCRCLATQGVTPHQRRFLVRGGIHSYCASTIENRDKKFFKKFWGRGPHSYHQ